MVATPEWLKPPPAPLRPNATKAQRLERALTNAQADARGWLRRYEEEETAKKMWRQAALIGWALMLVLAWRLWR